jgi:predicted dehydrogenase
MGALRVGIVGTGMMGIEHARNLLLRDDARWVAAADPHEASRGAAGLVGGTGVALFADPREMLERCALDAVIVATPNHTHEAVLADLLGRELHLLVEKPLCTTLEACRRVEAAAARHPGVFQVGMEYRYMPPVARFAEELRAGRIGRLRMLAIREHRFPFLPKVGDWNRFARNTGGTLVEKCCHHFDLMRWLVGAEALRVYASGAQDVNHKHERYGGETPDILDNAYAVVDFENGCRALLDLCMFAEGSRNQEELCAVGDAGKLECFVPEGTLVIGRRSPRQVERLRVPVDPRLLAAGFHHGATFFQHEAFLRAIRSGAAPEDGAREGTQAVALGLAAERSAAEGRAVPLAEL